MAQLIAAYSFHYGPKGKLDAEAPLVKRGETFTVLPTILASADEVARFLVRDHIAYTAEGWAKRNEKADPAWTWAAKETARANEETRNWQEARARKRAAQ